MWKYGIVLNVKNGGGGEKEHGAWAQASPLANNEKTSPIFPVHWDTMGFTTDTIRIHLQTDDIFFVFE